MKVLVLGPTPEPIMRAVMDFGDEAVTTNVAPGLPWPDAEFVISYNYRHIIPKEIIDRYPRKIINIHIGYLPWNRGADPTFWSFYDDTPRGVAIHRIDEGIDTGPILARCRTEMVSPQSTLRSYYGYLHWMANLLFLKTWEAIRDGYAKPTVPDEKGSYHGVSDRIEIDLDTPVSIVQEMGRQARGNDTSGSLS